MRRPLPMTARPTWRLALVAAGLLMSSLARPSECPGALRGVNIAGGEFASQRLPGVSGQDYKFPSLVRLRYYQEVGFNAIRLPILWERIQPTPLAALDQSYLSDVRETVKLAGSLQLKVVIDLHNYARHRGQLLGSETVPKEALKDVWVRLAQALGDLEAVEGWGLMNEPYRTQGSWAVIAQLGVDGVRQVDGKRTIYVGGDSFSSAERWPKEHPQPFVKDPAGKVVYEAHAYIDPDASGKYNDLQPASADAPAATAEKRLRPFVDWLKRHGQRGMIGEYGVPATEPAWFPGMAALLDIADQACLSTFVWAGGAWSPGYKLSLEPVNGVDKPLAGWFRQRLAAPRKP